MNDSCESFVLEEEKKSMKISFDNIHVSKSTFRNGLAQRVHRWFRLTPSFGPDLVMEMVNKLEIDRSQKILDPFSGAGTTLIETKLEGFNSIGFEINPLLHFVNEASLNWNIDLSTLRKELERIYSDFQKGSNIEFADLATNGLVIPAIHNPIRWWRPDVLTKLLVLKRAINCTKDSSVRNFFLLGFAGVLVPDLTNVTLGRLQLHFIDRAADQINVWTTFSDHVKKMICDVEELQSARGIGSSRCYLQNSTDLSSFDIEHKIGAVITSPPYPNRYSYVWNTRPHLYMLDMFSTPREASALDKTTIGGTWGTATSELAKGIVEPYHQAIFDVVLPVSERIRERDNLMANYVVHYFNRIAQQLLEMEKILSPSARLAYVVGNSWIKEIYIETDVMLAEIMERLEVGYTTNEVHRFRRRNSGKDLYESIVYARK